MKNWINWFEIPASDIGRAQKFYETVFGIQFEFLDLGVLKMAVFPHAEISGALVQHPEFYFPSEKGALIYLNGEPNLSIFLDRVEPAGGKIVVPKRLISPENGYMGIFMDTEGNRIALHSNA